jgi:chaperonin GroES
MSKNVCPFRPLNGRVVILPDDPAGVSRGGIVIPDAGKERPTRGKVVATGPGRTLDDGRVHPLQVAAGDSVLFNAYAGSDVEHDGRQYKIMSESEVIAQV